MPDQPTRPYYVDIPLRWSDMDSLRHINNVQYLRLMEEARVVAFSQWFGSDMRRPRMVISRAEVEYRHQLHFRVEPIVISIWINRITAVTFDCSYEVLSSREPDAQCYAVAETTQVLFDLEAGRPNRIAPEARAVLERYAAEPVRMRRRR